MITSALDLGYPPVDLALGMAVHTAPRVLELGGACSDPVLPRRSILAGCAQSIPFVRALLRKPLDVVVGTSPGARTAAYVDDVSQFAMGTFLAVVNALVDAGLVFARVTRKLKLTISSKSVVVASSPKLAQEIAAQLKSCGQLHDIRVASSARDLGICNNPSRRRRTTLQQERLKKAKLRTAKVSSMAKSVRRARVRV